MHLWRHPQFCERGLWVLAVGGDEINSDVLSRTIIDFPQYRSKALAKIKTFCVALHNGRFLSREHCNSLGHGLLELKPKPLRLIFFMDDLDDARAIIFVESFQKKSQTTPRSVIGYALSVKEGYFEDRGRLLGNISDIAGR